MTPSKALAKIDTSEYLAIVDDEAPKKLAVALEDYGLGEFDLPKLPVPQGGGRTWEIETLEGPVESKELTVILVKVKMGLRQYYPESTDDEEAQAPWCQSKDGTTGFGIRDFGETEKSEQACASCPLGVWGDDGTKPACATYANAMVLMPGSLLPHRLKVSVTSISSKDPKTPGLKNYIKQLINGGKMLDGVLTKLTLNPQTQGSKKWSTIVFHYGGSLDEATHARVQSLAAPLAKILDQS
jgi:hypothetical protein